MTDQAISPPRRRMIEDMSIRKFGPNTPTSASSRNSRSSFADRQTRQRSRSARGPPANARADLLDHVQTRSMLSCSLMSMHMSSMSLASRDCLEAATKV
jgi:hypothetical protein